MAARHQCFRVAIQPVGPDSPSSCMGKELFWIHSRAVSVQYFLPNIPVFSSCQNIVHVSITFTPPNPIKELVTLDVFSVVSGTGQDTPNLAASAPFGTPGVYRINVK